MFNDFELKNLKRQLVMGRYCFYKDKVVFMPVPKNASTSMGRILRNIGWKNNHKYLPLQDDIASVAFWYQTLPTQAFKSLPDIEVLDVK